MATCTGVEGYDTIYVVQDFITEVEFYVKQRDLKNPAFNIINTFIISAYNHLEQAPANYVYNLVDTRLGDGLAIGAEKELNTASDEFNFEGVQVPRYSVRRTGSNHYRITDNATWLSTDIQVAHLLNPKFNLRAWVCKWQKRSIYNLVDMM
jgi:hypothetical protein